MRIFITGGHDIERSALGGFMAEQAGAPLVSLDELAADAELQRAAWVSEAAILSADQRRLIADMAQRVIVMLSPNSPSWPNHEQRLASQKDLCRRTNIVEYHRHLEPRITFLPDNMAMWPGIAQSVIATSDRS